MVTQKKRRLTAGRLAQLETNHDDSMGEYLELREYECAALVSMAQELLILEKAAIEVWASVPASYDPSDPMMIRHAKALNALGTTLKTAR